MLLYGFLVIGLMIGYLGSMLFGTENGLSITPCMFLGVLGSYTGGLLVMAFNFGGEPMFAVIGAVCFVFIGNVFRPNEDTATH